MTEVAGAACFPILSADHVSSSIGVPGPHFEYKVRLPYPQSNLPYPFQICDTETGEMLPIGKTGEIALRGPIIMSGYYKNDEATTEALREDGWLYSGTRPRRVHLTRRGCTGDIGYCDENGRAYVIDRKKELIKVKGTQVQSVNVGQHAEG